MTWEFEYQTPYQYADCDPIANIDLDGLEKLNAIAAAGNKAAGFVNQVNNFSTIASFGSYASLGLHVAKGLTVAETAGVNALIAKALLPTTGQTLGAMLGTAGATIFLTVLPLQAGPAGNWETLGYRMATEPLPIKYKPKPEEQENENLKVFYATYTKQGPSGDVYSGRTSGLCQCKNGGEPTDAEAKGAVLKREAGHKILRGEKFSPAKWDHASTNYDVIRGREQDLVDYYGGAQNEKGYSRNKIRAVSRKKALFYQTQSQSKYGKLPNNNPADKKKNG